MYRVSHEFTFEIRQESGTIKFLAQLIFEGKQLNSIGSLYTDEELAQFGAALNQSINVPEYWTLETLSEHMFRASKPIFQNLKSVNLTVENSQHKVAEYTMDDDYIDVSNLVELPEVVG